MIALVLLSYARDLSQSFLLIGSLCGMVSKHHHQRVPEVDWHHFQYSKTLYLWHVGVEEEGKKDVSNTSIKFWICLYFRCSLVLLAICTFYIVPDELPNSILCISWFRGAVEWLLDQLC